MTWRDLELAASEVAEPTAAAEEEDGEQDHEPDQPAAATERNRQAPGHPAAATSLILDLRGIELGVFPEPHLRLFFPPRRGFMPALSRIAPLAGLEAGVWGPASHRHLAAFVIPGDEHSLLDGE